MKTIIKNTVLALSIITATTANAQSDEKRSVVMPALNPQSPLAELVGNHVGIRVPDYVAAIKWYTEKLDFRVVHEWDYADEKLAYVAPANSNSFFIEILGNGKINKQVKFNDLGKSLEVPGYHHICFEVQNIDIVVAELKKRGVTVIGDVFYLAAISRKLAFIQDPWGNMIELAEVVK